MSFPVSATPKPGELLCDVNERLMDRPLNAVVEDEGRPLGVGVQKLASNQAVLL